MYHIEVIPAHPNASGIVEVSLMRKMNYKNPYMKKRVRRDVIWAAAEYLCKQELYIEEGVTLNSDWHGNSFLFN